MKRTFFSTPILSPFLRLVSRLVLKLSGWKVIGQLPDIPKFVVIAAPHTSNWDFPYMLFYAFYYKAKPYWMGKDALFKKPFGTIMKWMGGIAIDRSKANNVVGQIVDQFNSNDKLLLVIPPAGTRKRVLKWKTGFYYIALQAKVPIALTYLDYKKKVGGFGELFYPTGDIDKDMVEIMKFYEGISGKHSHETQDTKVNLPEIAPKKVKLVNQ